MNTLFNAPREVVFCKKCVMSNQSPNSVVEFKNTGKTLKPTIFFGKNSFTNVF